MIWIFSFVKFKKILLKRFKQFSYIVMRWIILFTIYRCNTLRVEKIIRIAAIYMNRRVFTSALSSIIVSKKIKNKFKSTESKSGKSHFVGVIVTAICWYFHVAFTQSNINNFLFRMIIGGKIWTVFFRLFNKDPIFVKFLCILWKFFRKFYNLSQLAIFLSIRFGSYIYYYY